MCGTGYWYLLFCTLKLVLVNLYRTLTGESTAVDYGIGIMTMNRECRKPCNHATWHGVCGGSPLQPGWHAVWTRSLGRGDGVLGGPPARHWSGPDNNYYPDATPSPPPTHTALPPGITSGAVGSWAWVTTSSPELKSPAPVM